MPQVQTKGPWVAPWVMLAWNASPGSISNYNVYYGVASRTYTNLVQAGNATNCIVTNLWAGRTYFFAATAVNDSGLESEYSTEVSYTVPGGVLPPTNYLLSVTVQQSQDMTNWTTATNLPALSFTNATGAALYWRALMNIQAQGN